MNETQLTKLKKGKNLYDFAFIYSGYRICNWGELLTHFMMGLSVPSLLLSLIMIHFGMQSYRLRRPEERWAEEAGQLRRPRVGGGVPGQRCPRVQEGRRKDKEQRRLWVNPQFAHGKAVIGARLEIITYVNYLFIHIYIYIWIYLFVLRR